MHCQYADSFAETDRTLGQSLRWVSSCALSLLRESFLSVRGYGLRTYKSRQGRNAATVV